MPERGDEQFAVVLAVGRAPVAGAARIGTVGGQRGELRAERTRARRAVAEQSPGEPVVRERDRGDARGVLRFGVAQPAQLGGGEARDGNAAGAACQLGGAELGDEGGCRPGAARVVPQQRGPDHLARGVEHDHAVLLPADGDRGDVIEAARVGDRGLEGGPPGIRMHLGAVGMPGAPRAHHGSGLQVANHHLAALGGGIDPCDERHSSPQPRDPRPNRVPHAALPDARDASLPHTSGISGR